MDEKVIEELNKVEQKIDFLCQKLQIIENILKHIIPTIQVKGKI